MKPSHGTSQTHRPSNPYLKQTLSFCGRPQKNHKEMCNKNIDQNINQTRMIHSKSRISYQPAPVSPKKKTKRITVNLATNKKEQPSLALPTKSKCAPLTSSSYPPTLDPFISPIFSPLAPAKIPKMSPNSMITPARCCSSGC